MNRILLDTSAYSHFKRNHAEMIDILQIAEEIYLSPIVLGELRAGFAAGGRRKENETELREFLDSPRVRVLTVNEEASEFYAAIYSSLRQAGSPIPSNDLWIAATAMQHGLHLVTSDRHFMAVQQVIVHLLS